MRNLILILSSVIISNTYAICDSSPGQCVTFKNNNPIFPIILQSDNDDSCTDNTASNFYNQTLPINGGIFQSNLGINDQDAKCTVSGENYVYEGHIKLKIVGYYWSNVTPGNMYHEIGNIYIHRTKTCHNESIPPTNSRCDNPDYSIDYTVINQQLDPARTTITAPSSSDENPVFSFDI